jgi:hypothetical protein
MRAHLQDDQCSTPPCPMPSGLDGEPGAEAHDQRPRCAGASHHRAALAQALSRPGRGGLAEPLGTGPTEADAPGVGADDPGVGYRRPGGGWARSSALDLRRAGDVGVSDHGQHREADGSAGLLSAPGQPAVPANLSLCARGPRGATGRPGRTGGVKKKAQAGAGVLLRPDEARCPLVPPLRATLGVKGHRPPVGTWDHKAQGYCFAALHVVTGQRTTRLLEQPARRKAKTGLRTQPRWPVACATHLREIARAYPARRSPKGISTMAKAPWHRGTLLEQG